MTTTLTIRQIMSIHSGFAYCDGRQIGDAVKFMIGNDGFIAALSFQPYMEKALEQQYPWLREVPKQPSDWKHTAEEFEQRYGNQLPVKNNPEQLNGIYGNNG
jgi:hypothetical protein